MLTPNRLFRKRGAAYWSYQFRTARTVIDWTVALYIVIPALFAAGYQYTSWWRETPPWMLHLPFWAVSLLVYVVAASGTVRLFVEDGDQLFLVQRHTWMRTIKRNGLMYSAAIHLTACLLLLAVLLPALVLRFQLTVFQIAAAGLFLWLLRMDISLAVNRLSARFFGWRYWLVTLFFHMVCGAAVILGLRWLVERPLVLVAITLALLMGAWRLAAARLELKGAFFHDVEREQRQKLKLTALLLRGIIEKKTRQRRRKPILFPSSGRLFPKRTPANGLAEMCLKSFFRSPAQVRLYLQFNLAGAAAVGLPFIPVAVKSIVWLSLAFLIGLWMKGYWREAGNSPFVRMFPWKDSDRMEASQKSVLFTMLPGYLLISLVFGLSAFSWAGFIMIPAGFAVSFLVSHVYSSF